VTCEHVPGIYNLGWGRPTSVNQIFTSLAAITEYNQQANYGPAKVGETRHIYLDASKAMKDFGWAPTRTLEEGLRETVEYFRTSEKAM
jgi:UDP-glucose 4-epimerase